MAHTLSEINVLLLIARAAARETNANLMGNRHPSPASVFQLRLRKLKLVGFEIDHDFQILLLWLLSKKFFKRLSFFGFWWMV